MTDRFMIDSSDDGLDDSIVFLQIQWQDVRVANVFGRIIDIIVAIVTHIIVDHVRLKKRMKKEKHQKSITSQILAH